MDFGITDEAHSSDLQWIRLREDEFFLAAPTAWVRLDTAVASLSDFRGYTFLLQETYGPEFQKALSDMGFTKFQRIYTNNGQSMLAMVEQRLGVTLVSELNQSICPANVTMLPTEPNYFRDLGIIARWETQLDAPMLQFIDILKKVCAE